MPTAIGCTTWFTFGSIFETVPSRLFATQTKPCPIAIPLGPWPTWIVSTSRFVDGSIRETVPSSAFVTQIAPRPTAIFVGVAPTPTSPTRWPDGSKMPTESPATAFGAPPRPPWPSAKIGIATAAAITPASADRSTGRRPNRFGSRALSALSGGNAVCRPSMSSW